MIMADLRRVSEQLIRWYELGAIPQIRCRLWRRERTKASSTSPTG